MTSKILSIIIMLNLVASCRSTQTKPTQLKALDTPPVTQQLVEPIVPPEPECLKPVECPGDEPVDPYQCTLYRYGNKVLWETERLKTWGQTACLAAKAMAELTCREKKDAKQIQEISCTPDPSGGRCPAPITPCPESKKPSKCYAKAYEQSDIPWDQRPTAWGTNECDARNKLNQLACQAGLNPENLAKIECEPDAHPGLCPLPAPSCPLEHKEPTECTISQIGDISLKKPWVAVGTSVCEAQFRLQQLACLFGNSLNQLTPQKLGSMECRGLVVTSPVKGKIQETEKTQ